MNFKLFSWVKSVFAISLFVSLTLIGIRQLGWLESSELAIFDQMLRLQVNPFFDRKITTDQPIVVVEVTEKDIKLQKKWPLLDRVIAQTLKILNQHQPVAIGLDIFRDIENEPGYEELQRELKKNNVISICKVSGTVTAGIAPPSQIPSQQLGFADVTVDQGGIVRRGLIFTEPSQNSPCQTKLSLAFQLAQKYLALKNLNPELTKNNQLKWNKTVFKKLTFNSGSYQKIDDRGYQILLNYQLLQNPPRMLTLDQILKHNFQSDWIKNKIVLIGVNAPSIDDAFYTPYSASDRFNQKMAGVMIHAQLTSQIINATLGQNKLFWYWPEWLEMIWILAWGLTGGIIIYFIHDYIFLIPLSVGSIIILNGSCFFLFLQGAWLPLIPANLSLGGSLIFGLISNNIQAQKEKEKIALQLKQQEQDLILLKSLLKNNHPVSKSTHPITVQIKPESEIKTTLITQAQNLNLSINKLLVGRYNLLKILGSGGFGYAYLAEDIQRPGKPKCLVKQLQPASGDEEFLQVARRLFQTEASILEKIGHHPQIPQLLAHFEEDQQFYLVEEFIPGTILSKEIQDNIPFSEKSIIKLLKEILFILSFIHSQGVIHRDLKPANMIRRQKDQRLVLIDFGAVKEMQPHHQYLVNENTIAIGTRGYTPAEQLAGKPYFNSDLYALGMIAIQALTGITPEKLPRDEHNGEIEWHHLVNLSPALTNIIDQMICYHFKERYQSADLIIKDLNKL